MYRSIIPKVIMACRTGRQALFVVMLLTLTTLIVDATYGLGATKTEHSFSDWYWAWRQPPYQFRYLGGYPYVEPPVVTVAWGGTDFDILFAGSQFLDYATYPGGLHRSSDGGETWTYKGRIDPNEYMTMLVVHPVTPTIMLAVFDRSYYQGGIYRSVDGGENWTNVLPYLYVSDVGIDLNSPNRLYASAAGSAAPPGSQPGIYRSDDVGQTWQRISDVYRTGIAVHPVSSNVLFSIDSAGVYRSDDSGANWTKISDLWQSRIAIDPHTPDRMFIFGEYDGLWRTDNGGTTWMHASEGLPSPVGVQVVQSVAFDPTSPNTIWAGLKYGGMYISYDAGDTWYEVNAGIPFVGAGIFGPQCTTIDIAPDSRVTISCDGRLYVGLALSEKVFLPLVMR